MISIYYYKIQNIFCAEFTKTGDIFTIIEMTLYNGGVHGIEQGKYGNEIPVTRTITENSNTFTKMRVWQSYLETIWWLQKQINNNVFVLNEASARELLEEWVYANYFFWCINNWEFLYYTDKSWGRIISFYSKQHKLNRFKNELLHTTI